MPWGEVGKGLRDKTAYGGSRGRENGARAGTSPSAGSRDPVCWISLQKVNGLGGATCQVLPENLCTTETIIFQIIRDS